MTTRKNQKIKEVNYLPTQDFIPVRAINNGIIETTDGRYVKILEIRPNNFAMRSASEKNDIIFNFECWLKSAPVSIQFKVITRKAKSNRHLNAVEQDLKFEKKRFNELPAIIEDLKQNYLHEISTTDETKKNSLKKQLTLLENEFENLKKDLDSEKYNTRQELGREYIELVKSLSNHEALSRRFFLIFQYEGNKYANYSEIVTTLKLIEQQARSSFSMCENEIDTQKPEDEDIFSGEVLYNLLNRKKCQSVSFENNVSNIAINRMAKNHLVLGRDNVPDIPIVDCLAPSKINLSNRKFLYIDGTYYTFLMLSSNGYASSVCAGWLNPIVNAGDGIDIDIFAHKEDTDSIKFKVNNKLANHIVKDNDTSVTDNSKESVEGALNSCMFIKDSLKHKEDFYYMNVLITITADNLEMLDLKRRSLITELKSNDLDVFNCSWRYEQAFISSLPLCKLDRGLMETTKRNVTTSGLASTYIFTAYELCDDNGILYGVNSQNESLCMVDIFNSKIYKNANMCFLSTSGGGKTFTLIDISLRFRIRNIPSFIIAPLKGHEFRRACNWVGGEFVKISPGSRNCVNLLDIRIPDKTADEAIEGISALGDDSLLAKKIQSIKIAFLLLIPEMTNVQEQLLDEALIETYRRKKITHDNDSLFIAGTTELKEMPIIEDLYNVILENERLKDVASVINLLVTGSASNFNGHTNVNLDNNYIVFDISELTGKLLPFGMFVVLDYVMGKVKEDRTQKKAVLIDELWKLIGTGSNINAAEFVLEIFKTIRGYYGCAIGASQDLNDFFSLENGKYGKGIINSCAIKIIKFLEQNEAEAVQKAMDLTDNEIREIRRFERPQGLFCANNSRVSVRFIATDLEKALITTDGAELAELKMKGYRDYT